MKKGIVIAIMAGAIALLASYQLSRAEGVQNIAIMRADKTKIPFRVELAVTRKEQEQGLMHRKSVPEGTGMLFVYDAPARRVFWMKDTLVPLDMLFFGRKGELVHIHPNATPRSLAVVGPDTDNICTILEIAGGEAKRLGINPGDRLIFNGPDCR